MQSERRRLCVAGLVKKKRHGHGRGPVRGASDPLEGSPGRSFFFVDGNAAPPRILTAYEPGAASSQKSSARVNAEKSCCLHASSVLLWPPAIPSGCALAR